VPTLFLIGENEKLYSAHAALGRLSQVAPKIKTMMIPDAGHGVTLVRAQTVNAIVLDFLDRPRHARSSTGTARTPPG
jgi:pimeloyl-ACP methyl ester carboxylesterase